MKFKIILSMLALLLATSFSYASFPVERVATTTATATSGTDAKTQTLTKSEAKKEVLVSPAAAAAEKSQGVAFLFWLLLWPFAAHRWYLGSPWYWNVLFIITFGGIGIWAIIDIIGILTGSYEPHDGSYKDSFF